MGTLREEALAGDKSEICCRMGLSLVKSKGFKEVSRNRGHKLSGTLLKVLGHLKVGKYASEKVSIREGRVTTQVGYAIHVIEDN